MSRKLMIALAATATMGVSAAQANAAEYEGAVNGDPQSNVEFSVEKVDGKRMAGNVIYTNVDAECENGDQAMNGLIPASTRVRDGKFDLRYEAASFKGRFTGTLKANGKATGTIKIRDQFMPPLGLCKSEELPWKAEKQT